MFETCFGYVYIKGDDNQHHCMQQRSTRKTREIRYTYEYRTQGGTINDSFFLVIAMGNTYSTKKQKGHHNVLIVFECCIHTHLFVVDRKRAYAIHSVSD